MTAVRHCGHCWGDCPGDCLLDDTGMCIHNANTMMIRQLRAQRPLSLRWLRMLLRAGR
jgi:hypothetical protein